MNSLQDHRWQDAFSLAVASFATLAKHEGTVFALWGANWAMKQPGTGIYLPSTFYKYRWLQVYTPIRSPTPLFNGQRLMHTHTNTGWVRDYLSEISIIWLFVVIIFASPHHFLRKLSAPTLARGRGKPRRLGPEGFQGPVNVRLLWAPYVTVTKYTTPETVQERRAHLFPHRSSKSSHPSLQAQTPTADQSTWRAAARPDVMIKNGCWCKVARQRDAAVALGGEKQADCCLWTCCSLMGYWLEPASRAC